MKDPKAVKGCVKHLLPDVEARNEREQGPGMGRRRHGQCSDGEMLTIEFQGGSAADKVGGGSPVGCADAWTRLPGAGFRITVHAVAVRTEEVRSSKGKTRPDKHWSLLLAFLP